MKQIHVWRNHVAITHLDLILTRDPSEPLSQTLEGLQRRGIPTRTAEVVVHDGVVAP